MRTFAEALSKIGDTDFERIHLIAERAVDEMKLGSQECMTIEMDLTAVHAYEPLRLVDMLHGKSYDFLHDICGITSNLNRKTLELENCFLPRFTA